MNETERREILRQFKDHKLTLELYTPTYKAWLLAVPDTINMSTRIVETPEGFCIIGDYSPGGHGQRGVVSDIGYGAAWFAGATSHNYLAEKFNVPSVFSRDKATMWVRRWLDSDSEYYAALGHHVVFESMIESLMGEEYSFEDFRRDAEDLVMCFSDYVCENCFWILDPEFMKVLTTIQVVFRDRWLKMYPPKERDNEDG